MPVENSHVFLAVDILRWISIAWLAVGMGWLMQIAVITRSLAVTMLASGLILSLFIDLGSQYQRLGKEDISYQLPVVYIELFLITLGMYFYVKSHEQIRFIPPFYFFIKFRNRRQRRKEDSEDIG